MAKRKSFGGGASRDLGVSGNGKGDKTRVVDRKAYNENFDAIDWHKNTSTQKSVTECVHSASVARCHSDR